METSVRKPYTQPEISQELDLETRAGSGVGFGIDPWEDLEK